MNDNMILNIPHASTWITGVHCPPAVNISTVHGAYMRMLRKQLLPMTDWYTDELFINGMGIPIVAPVSRIICDTERFRNDEDEPMARIGMGVCYARTYDLKYPITWRKGHKEWVLENLYDVHHRNLELAVDRTLSEHGKVLILDCHSFSPVPLPYEPDQDPDRPDICIGTDPFHTPQELIEKTQRFFKDKGFSVEINRPYSGTIVPLRHLNRDKRVNSLMIELNRGLYLKDGTKEKNDFFPILKQHLKEYQEKVIHPDGSHH